VLDAHRLRGEGHPDALQLLLRLRGPARIVLAIRMAGSKRSSSDG
jgi:hypothetical protein